MQRLWPDPGPVDDVVGLIAGEARPSRPGRPWVAVNMVTSADGATAVDGVSGSLGDDGDTAVFRALRGSADVILAGAGTVRAERYRPPRVSDAARAARRARGQAEVPRVAVVSRSLDLDWDAPLFREAEPGAGPLVVTCTGADPDRRARAAEVAEVVVAGDEAVDLARALVALGERGAAVVVAEGGPRLNGELLAADLVDEWCLTVSPVLAGGSSSRAARGAGPGELRALRLARVLESDGSLLLRYVRP